MTIIDEILICANQLANAGKKPTVALVKSKLSQSAPLITIITTLKNWQHQPDFIGPMSSDEKQTAQEAPINSTVELLDSLIENGAVKKIIQQSLAQELAGMKKELHDVKQLIKALTEQIEQQK